jgi:glycosyltransferase involved in cell wall biosynthesis
MTIGIKYFTFGTAVGYSLAGLAYIRALHNAGVPVWPFFVGSRNKHGPTLGRAIADDANFADIPALMKATAQPIAYDTVLAHLTPDNWDQVAESGKRLIGYAAWEAEGLPEHWPAMLNKAERILVPCCFNVELFARGGVRRPVHVVPHIRRHTRGESAPEDGAALRLRLGIPADHFVFYSIAEWDPRKALSDLIDLFAREFSCEEPVTLLLKTSAKLHRPVALEDRGKRIQELVARIVERAHRETGRQGASVVVIAADDIGGGEINAIHAAGDTYVSLTHGEGWGLGAFDAATFGKPVIITGWGGQLDYLGSNYPGLVRYEMTPITGWYPLAGSRLTHRWATADKAHAVELMRMAVAREGTLADAAKSLSKEIDERYAEPVVAGQLIEAIGSP